MSRLVALALPNGKAFVDALSRAWDDGDAVFPVDVRAPPPARARLLDAMRPSVVVEPGAVHERPDGRPVEPDDALVMATSGTTGEPKGAVLTHEAITASALTTSARLGVDPNTDKWLACLPLHHIGGLSVVTRALVTGTPFEVLDRFDPSAVDQVARHGATLVSMVPTMLDRVDASLWQRILLGGAAMPPDRPANTIASYGMTETGSGMVYDHRPLDGVELKVIDNEIHVRGPILLRAYRDGHDPKDADGWFATGDGGEIDPSGRIDVHGRIGDMIISGGENVWPVPIEKLLHGHPGVREVAVVGRPDPEWGQLVTAVIVASAQPDLDLHELRAVVKAQLPAHCAPRAIEYVDALTRAPSGKVQREAL